MLKPSPEHFLHGDRGQRVIPTPQHVINILAARGQIKRLRAEIDGRDPVVDAWITAVVMAAVESAPASDPGTVSAPTPEVAPRSTETRTTRQVSVQLKLRSTRQVTNLCVAGCFPGAFLDSEQRWRIPVADVSAYLRR